MKRKTGKKQIEIIKKIPLYSEDKKTGVSFLRGKKGVYLIYLNNVNNLLYVGRASTDLEDVITRHFQSGNNTQVKFKRYPGNPDVNYFARVYLTPTKKEAADLERMLIKELAPQLNVRVPADDKSISKWKKNRVLHFEQQIRKKIDEATGQTELTEDQPF